MLATASLVLHSKLAQALEGSAEELRCAALRCALFAAGRADTAQTTLNIPSEVLIARACSARPAPALSEEVQTFFQ